MITNSQIEKHHEETVKMALELLEHKARVILKAHPNLQEFVMAMGTFFFTDRDGHPVNNPPWYMQPVHDLIDDWDRRLCLTGAPMRFTATGPIRHDW